MSETIFTNQKNVIERFNNSTIAIERLFHQINENNFSEMQTEILNDCFAALADNEAHAYIRIRMLLAEPTSTLMIYNKELWHENLNYHSTDFTESYLLFSLLRKSNANCISKISSDKWVNTLHHPDKGSLYLQDILNRYADNTFSTIKQLEITAPLNIIK